MVAGHAPTPRLPASRQRTWPEVTGCPPFSCPGPSPPKHGCLYGPVLAHRCRLRCLCGDKVVHRGHPGVEEHPPLPPSPPPPLASLQLTHLCGPPWPWVRMTLWWNVASAVGFLTRCALGSRGRPRSSAPSSGAMSVARGASAATPTSEPNKAVSERKIHAPQRPRAT